MSLVKAYRMHGHLNARLDPLGSEPMGDPALDESRLQPPLTDELQARIPARLLRLSVPGETLLEALPRLRDVYTGTIAYEIEHISDHAERVWLRQAIESGRFRGDLEADERRGLLRRLAQVGGVRDVPPARLHRPEAVLDRGARRARADARRGRRAGRRSRRARGPDRDRASWPAQRPDAHRRPFVRVDPQGVRGRAVDRRAHRRRGGRNGRREVPPRGVRVAGDARGRDPGDGRVESEPSRGGRSRSSRGSRAPSRPIAHRAPGIHDPTVALPILIHGDASFAGQGVVAETFNLHSLDGYSTGGTLHLIANNQVGFTTDPAEGRSTRYSSDLAKGFDVPIVHVNADDPEAAIAAIRLALAYREEFGHDVVVDLVGYRRFGHNEQDEAAYTQPLQTERIVQQPPVRESYAQTARRGRHRRRGRLGADARGDARGAQVGARRSAAVVRVAGAAGRGADADRYRRGGRHRVAAERLLELGEQLLRVPDGFEVNPKLARQLERRRETLREGGIDWGHAEALAFASLLEEGIPIRLSGQDTERGTFSHRQAVLHDPSTGETYTPSAAPPDGDGASFEIYNSPLSEYAALAFEHGYSIAAPDALVLWEAQFGDFVNGAQIVVDQFIVSGRSKWGQTSRLALLLPHGYEGNGPEHSSARLERFLQLAAQDNIRVVNCTTAGQFFHLLRGRLSMRPRARSS